MATKKKLLQAAAGAAGGAGLDVDEVFSTYLYDGTNATQTITNGIDLAGEGGMVWQKLRTHPTPPDGQDHYLRDSERGVGYNLESNTTDAQFGDGGITSFNSNGFSLSSGSKGNLSGATYASWTFRKAPKFFDVVTYTGNTVGNSAQTISHGLGSTPGLIIVKRYSTSDNWIVWHRSITNGFAALNDSGAWLTNNYTSFITSVGSTSFTVGESLNTNGASFVAYVFAHNNNDGTFGPSGDQDIIKCGTLSHTSGTPTFVDCGFEASWIIVKRTDTSDSWWMADSMRGLTVNGINSPYLAADLTSAEGSSDWIGPNAQGFDFNYQTGTYVYMAIRRGPLAEPTSATDVFAIDTRGASEPSYDSGFPVDLGIIREANSSGDWFVGSRLIQGKYLQTNTTSAEASASSYVFDYMDGWNSTTGSNSNLYSWMWKRAPGYFDVVAYTGTGSNRTVSHNLGVAPEMMWVKRRDTTASWVVYHKGLNGGTTPEDYVIELNNTGAEYNNANWNDTAPTSSVFSLGTANSVNNSSGTYIAYLFATVAGVSKVGSYTGNGSTQNIDCGFSSGARFVLIKCSSHGLSDWHVMDSTRGIVAGNDPFLYLNDTSAEDTGEDMIDPYSSGFALAANNRVNTSGRTYIFYAIA